MDAERISSRKNKYIAHLRALASDADYRYARAEYLCDGMKLLAEALDSLGKHSRPKSGRLANRRKLQPGEHAASKKNKDQQNDQPCRHTLFILHGRSSTVIVIRTHFQLYPFPFLALAQCLYTSTSVNMCV